MLKPVKPGGRNVCYHRETRALRRRTLGCCLAISGLILGACNHGQQEKNTGTGMSPIEAEAAQEALRKAYAAFNRNDIPATCETLDPNIEWTEPAEFPGGGTYHGHAGVRAYLTQSQGQWGMARNAPGRCRYLPQRQGDSHARIRRPARGTEMGRAT